MESEGLKRGGGRIPNKGTKSLIRQKKRGGIQSTNGEPSFAEEGKGHFFPDTEEEENWVVMPPGVWV